MYPSYEVRWFFSVMPFDYSVYFNVDNAQKERIDWYAFPCDSRTGVKIRDNRLETKLLLKPIGPRNFAQANGVVEHWRKWSVQLPANDSPTEAQLEAAGWVGITKHRYLRHFAIEKSALHEVDGFPDNGNGAQVEWTVITTAEQQWWTFAFESFGKEDQLEHNLSLLTNYIISENNIPYILDIGNSYGYPQWLHHLKQQ